MKLIQVQKVGKEIISDEHLFQALIAAYIEVFNSKGKNEWQEDWDYNEVNALLTEVFTVNPGIHFANLLIDAEKNEKIVGFCIGHIGDPESIILSSQMPKDLNINDKEKSKKTIMELLKNEEKIIFVQELGIIKEYRDGSKRVTNLIIPVLKKALEQKALTSTFWTSRHSKFHHLSSIANVKPIYDYKDKQENLFFATDTKKTLRVLMLKERIINNLLSVWKNQ